MRNNNINYWVVKTLEVHLVLLIV